MNIFTAKFGDIPVRFVYLTDRKAVFVSKDDVSAALKSCWASSVVPFETMPSVEDALGDFTDGSEKASAVLDVDMIGGVANVFSVGNLISALADLHDVDHPDLREFGFRVNALFTWYTKVMGSVADFYGIGFTDTMAMAKTHLDKHNAALSVSVKEFDGVWMAECDALGLVTEADSFEELRERVWEIAPELAELNELQGSPDDLRLHFAFMDSVTQHRLAG